MAGAYAKEYVKWLQEKNIEEKLNEEEDDSFGVEDSGDEVDNYQTNKMKRDKDGQAPVLFNNVHGNTRNVRGQNFFLDEPPILEPVRSTPLAKGSKSATISEKECQNCDKDFIGNYSQETYLELNRTDKLDTYKENSRPMIRDYEILSGGKVKESENIFDKFSLLPDMDDLPPPLIPSHEAHLTTVDAKDDDNITEKSYATLQNLSPNFCAMEADSTSEIPKTGENNSSSIFMDKGMKTMGNEFGVECDSTCMLGVSPHMVSPGSISNVDSDNTVQTPSHDENAHLHGENQMIYWNNLLSNDRNGFPPTSSGYGLNHNTRMDCEEDFATDQDNFQDSRWYRECPKLEAVMEVGEGKEMSQNKRAIDVDDPPVLIEMPPVLKTSSSSARKKRHTIDSVLSVKKRKQKSHRKNPNGKASKHSDHTTSPLISNDVFEDNATSLNLNSDQQFSSSSRRNSISLTHSSSCSHSSKHHRKRRQTLPIVDLSSYSGHLPHDLYKFVVDSSQLSNLQNRMHQLVSSLFPQLSSELLVMSPESFRFETLLKDLQCLLQDQESGLSKYVHGDLSSTIYFDSDNERKNIKNLSDVLPSVSSHSTFIGKSRSRTFGPNDQGDAKTETEENSVSSECEMDTASDPYRQHSSTSDSILESAKLETSNEPLVHSRLSGPSLVKETARVLKRQPSVVIHKDPCAVYKSYVRLSCSILQLLLPELGISLREELVDSPNDLLCFIDFVIASNSKIQTAGGDAL